VQGIEKLAG